MGAIFGAIIVACAIDAAAKQIRDAILDSKEDAE